MHRKHRSRSFEIRSWSDCASTLLLKRCGESCMKGRAHHARPQALLPLEFARTGSSALDAPALPRICVGFWLARIHARPDRGFVHSNPPGPTGKHRRFRAHDARGARHATGTAAIVLSLAGALARHPPLRRLPAFCRRDTDRQRRAGRHRGARHHGRSSDGHWIQPVRRLLDGCRRHDGATRDGARGSTLGGGHCVSSFSRSPPGCTGCIAGFGML